MSKIKKVVLYKHGVGHFERTATVDGDADVRIGFRSEEMNDVLKSLTVFDAGGGTISSISYDNQKPLSKLLSDISLDLPSSGGRVGLLSAVRGANVLVVAGARTIQGQVVGVDERHRRVAEGVTRSYQLTVFDNKGSVHAFDLDEVSEVNFLDEELKEDLQFYFNTLLAAKKQDTKSLKLFARGEGERELAISYVIECPVWKTSYRLALPGSPEDKPYLQGWALVDNPQDEDWKDVELSLISGLPISFTHDLYSPRYLKRQEVEVEREAAAGVVMAESGLFGSSAADAFAAVPAAPACEPPPPAPMMKRASRARKPAPAQAIGGSTKVETVTQKVGQLFEYRIDKPVTVLRNQSALVPIVGDEFEARRKSLFNESNRAENPFTVVDFQNTTGLTLEGGPLTVYEGGVYAGEAMMDTLGPNEERMLPFAVDLEVEAKVEREFRSQVTLITLKKGVWTQQTASFQTTSYAFHHKGDKSKELILEHPLSQAELVDTPKPDSETRNYWRFSLNLEPSKNNELTITEKSVSDDVRQIARMNPSQAMVLLKQTGTLAIDPECFAKVEALASNVSEIQIEESQKRQELKEKSEGQARIRENLKSLGQSSDENRLRGRYVAQLESQENEIEQLQSEIKVAATRKSKAEKAFREAIGTLSLEKVFEVE